jgi:hypothetical protein
MFAPEFAGWLDSNRHIWREFQRQADLVWGMGFRHYSARTILHFLRHHTTIAQVGGGAWKINNNWSADFARLYVLMHPDRDTFFEFRVIDGSKKRVA